MSDEDPKPSEERSALSGKQDPSTEAEEKPIGVEEGDSIENGNPSAEDEGTPLGEEGLSTENGNPSAEDEGTPLGEEGLSTENGNPSAEDEGTPLGEEGLSTENGNASVEDESTPVADEFSSLEDESTLTVVETPTVEEKHPAVKKEDSTPEEERPSVEEEYATADKGCSPKEEQPISEKECQTAEQAFAYVEPKCIIQEHEPIKTEFPSTVMGDGFFDRSIQTTLMAEPIDREIQTTLRLERSLSTSSLNASMGDDSASSLKECPSIEEEPPPEPIVGEVLKVRAQVMIRNDSTGGWVPEGCGGMSTVILYKIERPVKPGDKKLAEYVIRGKRLSDEKDNMTCTIFEDLEYNKVMPTFHHWKTGNKRFGLTFQTACEARIFGKSLQAAVYERMLVIDPNAAPKKFVGDDDDDFLAFTKPAEPRPRTPSPEVVYDLPDYLLPNAEEEERIQFMQLTSLPEYFYQDFRTHEHTVENKLRRRPYHRARKPLKFFGIIRRTTRLRCKYCHELYEEEDNKRGKCRYAPNKVKAVIDGLSCMRCTKWLMHDCMMDPDEDFSHPCTCGDDGYCGIRWVGLCLLSFVIPCILFYPPMTGCYYCGVRCGVCGERHEEKIIPRVEHII